MAPRDPNTLDMFRDWVPPTVAVATGPALHPDIKARVSQAISQSLKNCPKSREQIAQEMGVLLDENISINMVNNYASAGQDESNIPFYRLLALIEVTGDPSVVGGEMARLGWPNIPERYLGAVEEAQCAEQLETIEARRKIARRRWRGR